MGDTPNVSNSMTVRVQFKNDSGMLGRLASEIGRLGGDIGAVDLVSVGDGIMVRDLTINCRDDDHATALVAGVGLSTTLPCCITRTAPSCCTWEGRSRW